MIVTTIELHSAIDGRTEELGTLVICNDGTGSGSKGNYDGRMYRKGDAERHGKRGLWWKAKPTREARVEGHPRLAQPVQSLVAKMLKEMGYG